ncbi:unnamed protein product [Hermetia illucens]|uniref:Cytochrome b561 domain-containing protein n=1 Tax=Hermetia illucens TaxID=343691 RepID=A0A7R8ULJ9_HERIL|nr:unnamed protein product [Hermetia illucens]
MDQQITPNCTMEELNRSPFMNFKVLYITTQMVGITLIIIMGSWIGTHLGGFSWTSNPKTEFNWHPFLMTIGMVFLYGNSILIYRGMRRLRKKKLKLLHASIHMTAFVLVVIALIAVFDSHNLPAVPIPNLYSLHSWLGILAVILFACQWLGGFVSYLLPGMRQVYKEAYMPVHIFFGLFGFVLAVASALLGLSEKAFFSIGNYPELPNAGLMVNFMGVLLMIFGGLVVYLTTEPDYRRQPLPEDAILLTGANE